MNYFITAIHQDEWHHFKLFKIPRTFGYYKDLNEAIEAVKHNCGDIQECLYTHIVIEEIGEGIHPNVSAEYWFEWKDNHWERISSKPEIFNGLCNWALG